jgi:hypothetical protein
MIKPQTREMICGGTARTASGGLSQVIEVIVLGEQLGEPLTGVEHPRFHGVLRYLDDLSDLFDGFVMVINEVDDLAMLGREFFQAVAELGAAVRFQDGLFRGTGLIGHRFRHLALEFDVLATTARRQCLEARNRHDPDCNQRTAFEAVGFAPYIDEGVGDDVLSGGGVADEAGDEAENGYLVGDCKGSAWRRRRQPRLPSSELRRSPRHVARTWWWS